MITIKFTVEEIKEIYDSLESVEDDIQQEMSESPGVTLLESTYTLLDGIRKLKKEVLKNDSWFSINDSIISCFHNAILSLKPTHLIKGLGCKF